MTPLSQQILAHAAKVLEGHPLVASELLHMGNRAAVDQTLSRLAKRGQLIRASRGIYLVPVASRFGKRPPETSRVVEAVARLNGEVVVPNEVASANALGVTTQVPMRQTYLTSGKSRRMQLGRQVVEFKHAPAWKLRLANRTAGLALRAIAGAGPKNAHAMGRQVSKHLSDAELKELANASTHYMPVWLANELRELGANA